MRPVAQSAMSIASRRALPWAALLLLLALAWLAYRPGLSGGFLFDDFVNLDALGRYGPVDDTEALWRYLTSGIADPTGRPLSLLSFLLDARDWPADPAPFLRTNLLLHLGNGALLFLLLRQLGAHLAGRGARTDAAALLGGALWLLHPLFVSTTLYAVQREAMLPASFVLLGLLAYVHGRQLHDRRPAAGAAWMLGGIALGTLLGVLAKANGALLPLLALVLEATVLRAGDGARAAEVAHRLRGWRRLLLVLPTLLLAAWLLQRMPGLHADLPSRPWTMAERLLTQPRVLLDYLQLLLAPRWLSTGLYNDAYPVSTGWLQPASTLPALLAIIGLAAAAVLLRRRWPVFAAAVLFWLAGHLMESSVVALELFFEHRNYLPALLLPWAVAWVLCQWRAPAWIRACIAVALVATLALMTWQRASLWGQPLLMARLWVAHNPDSPRAQATLAHADLRSGHPEQASRRLASLLRQHPDELQIVLAHADAACASRRLTPAEAAGIETALRTAWQGHRLATQWLQRRIPLPEAHRCHGVPLAWVDAWVRALAANEAMPARAGRRQDLHALAGQLALARGDGDAAARHFAQALRARPDAEAAGAHAVALGSHGHPRLGLRHLALYDALAADAAPPTRWRMATLHYHVLERQGYWRRQLDALRDTLRSETSRTGTPSTAEHGDSP